MEVPAPATASSVAPRRSCSESLPWPSVGSLCSAFAPSDLLARLDDLGSQRGVELFLQAIQRQRPRYDESRVCERAPGRVDPQLDLLDPLGERGPAEVIGAHAIERDAGRLEQRRELGE